MKILLSRYHGIIDDLAISFSKLGHDVTICVNTDVKDHYGDAGKNLIKIQEENEGIKVIPLKWAMIELQQKKYDLLGIDGVYSGEDLLREMANKVGIPNFCIGGYPYLWDENSNNILAFGWAMPTVQYLQKYPSEGHVKEVDWKNICEKGHSDGKNILTFYPNFWKLKQKCFNTEIKNDSFISGIHRYEECNKWTYETFKKVSGEVKAFNFESRPQDEFLQTLVCSKGLLMLKWADMPGIALLQSLLLSKPVFTMNSYVLASMNPEVLIDGFNAIVADTVPELIDRMKNITDQELYRLGNNAFLHAEMLTRFERQKDKLQTFLNNCINKK